MIHNSKSSKDYTPSSNGIGGEDVWIMVNADVKGENAASSTHSQKYYNVELN
jgi:hypothetical protein